VEAPPPLVFDYVSKLPHEGSTYEGLLIFPVKHAWLMVTLVVLAAV